MLEALLTYSILAAWPAYLSVKLNNNKRKPLALTKKKLLPQRTHACENGPHFDKIHSWVNCRPMWPSSEDGRPRHGSASSRSHDQNKNIAIRKLIAQNRQQDNHKPFNYESKTASASFYFYSSQEFFPAPSWKHVSFYVDNIARYPTYGNQSSSKRSWNYITSSRLVNPVVWTSDHAIL